jgi:competence protein ComGC
MKTETKKKIWHEVKVYLFIIIMALLVCYWITTLMNDDQKCQEQGYQGTVTMFGLPMHSCYIDNRPNSINNVKFYPMNP